VRPPWLPNSLTPHDRDEKATRTNRYSGRVATWRNSSQFSAGQHGHETPRRHSRSMHTSVALTNGAAAAADADDVLKVIESSLRTSRRAHRLIVVSTRHRLCFFPQFCFVLSYLHSSRLYLSALLCKYVC